MSLQLQQGGSKLTHVLDLQIHHDVSTLLEDRIYSKSGNDTSMTQIYQCHLKLHAHKKYCQFELHGLSGRSIDHQLRHMSISEQARQSIFHLQACNRCFYQLDDTHQDKRV